MSAKGSIICIQSDEKGMLPYIREDTGEGIPDDIEIC